MAEDNDRAAPNAPPKQGRCPICGKTAEERWRPFCSKRCADIDLNRWLTGRYAIPAEEAGEPGDVSAEDDRRD
jgi:endogenous inhibitor of DNA gyrase (YacG/DUF329 family)